MIRDALRLSLQVSLTATLLVTVVGTLLGWGLARLRFRGRELVDALITLPLVLPPTVTGYYLLRLLGRHGLLGGPIYEATGFTVAFTWWAAVLAAALVSLPLMVRSARAAIEAVDPDLEFAAATLGSGPWRAFRRVTLPLARRGILAGMVLAFGRAVGEFGATLMIAGNIPGRTQTMPLAIWEAVVSGEDARARTLVLLLTGLSVAVLLLVGRMGKAAAVSAALQVRAGLDFQAVGRASFSLDVDLEFGPWVTAILGPSGSGKSTLLGVVAGRYRKVRGRVALGKRTFLDDSRRVFLAPPRRRLGYVFQKPLLFPHLTVLENVAFGIRRHMPGKRERQALEWLERVGAVDLVARHPTTLSGGEQQRVALARALAAEPRLVLLDEPTAALDLQARSEILEVTRSAQGESGVPFLYVCHSPSEATRIGDRAVVLSDGRVAQQGTPLEVLSAPGSLAVARTGGFENVLPARVLEHREQEGVTLVEVEGVRLEMGYHRLPVGAELDVALRAEDVIVALEPVRGTSARNVLEARVRRVREETGKAELEVTLPAPLVVSVTSATIRELRIHDGSRVFLLIKARAIHPLEAPS